MRRSAAEVAAAYSVLGAAPPHLHGLPRTLLYDSVAIASSVAILLGVRWYRPSPRVPWYLMAVAPSAPTSDRSARRAADSGPPVWVARRRA